MKKLFVYVLILIVTLCASEQLNPLKGEYFSSISSVPFNLPSDILQDSEGYYWFGTMHGLYRYDGFQFIQFVNDPNDSASLSFNDIVSLYEDSRGNIWVGTWGGGANKLNKSRERFSRIKLSRFEDEIVWDFAEDEDGNIFIATEKSGLFKYL